MKIALVGQPNSGKSTLFNAVAGYRSLTSNFAGTTVEYTYSRARVGGEVVDLFDLPGLYSLTPASPAETCSREFLLGDGWDVLVNVVDASQLARSLDLTLELLDLDAPLVVCLNMMDEAARKGIVIHSPALAEALGVPVVETIAARGQGVVETFRAALEIVRVQPPAHPRRIAYPPEVEGAIKRLAQTLCAGPGRESQGREPAYSAAAAGTCVIVEASAPPEFAKPLPNPRCQALQLLQSDPLRAGQLDPVIADAVESARTEIELQTRQPADAAVCSARHAACLNLFERVASVHKPHADWREQIDRLLMHPVWGYGLLVVIFLGFFRAVFGLGKLGE